VPQVAGVLEDDRAVALDVLGKLDAAPDLDD
jgi:hypothetical protein